VGSTLVQLADEVRDPEVIGDPVQARYRAAPRPDARIQRLFRGSAGVPTANPAQIPPNLAHNVAHWCREDSRVSEARRHVSTAGNATT
jgi:hypothetical protein